MQKKKVFISYFSDSDKNKMRALSNAINQLNAYEAVVVGRKALE